MDLREARASGNRHPWEVARADFFTGLVTSQLSSHHPVRVLDVGAGDGYLARRLFDALPPGSEIVCHDSSYTDNWIETHSGPGPRFSREAPAGRFDWVLLLDVLEHVPDDQRLLEQVRVASLGEGGTVLVAVPAWRARLCLYSASRSVPVPGLSAWAMAVAR